ncbi:MAG TPA: FAD-dependent oxidoreductase [Thermomicrobiales bacterium]|nr:FAD-dependent oxidoreductase [Thermomicrobiales bacterium]HRA30721.1 FAD-dependent oxidoreductase [Thermomicrobiales bacterium]
MFRCRICGYIETDDTQPVECPSCGASSDRFAPLTSDEVSQIINGRTSYGIVSQDQSETPVDDTRRIRLLAFVSSEMFSPFTRRSGARYAVFTGDQRWFADNIPCQKACPAHTDISRYIALIADGRYADSFELNRENNVFPGCLGRMCARPCETACRRQIVDQPIGICYLKRVASDYRGETRRETPPPPNGKTIGVIGAGAAGLSAARQVARQGYRVTIYEAMPVPSGMMWAGVPEWRLPRDVIMEEVELILDLGIELRLNTKIGEDISFQDLIDSHDAVVIAAGNQNVTPVRIPGEDLPGVVPGLTFLEEINLELVPDVFVGKRVVTVGGGFTSMDCVRSVLRLGAERSIMTYRRSAHEIPVDALEVEETELEGCEIMYMVSPTRCIAGEDGHVAGIEFVRNELGAPDASGRRRPEPVEGSEFVIECDQVIIAIGQYQDNSFFPKDFFPEVDRRGVPKVNAEGRTAHPKVFACGDYVTNPLNFISAIGDGKRVAEHVHSQLSGLPIPEPDFEITRVPIEDLHTPNPLMAEGVAEWSTSTMSRRLRWGDNYTSLQRQIMPTLPLQERGLLADETTLEVELGYPKPVGFDEAKRCLQCQLNIFIDGDRCILCNGCVDICPVGVIEMISTDRIYSIDSDVSLAELARAELGPNAVAMIIDELACIRCGACVEWCPTECLTMEHYRPVPLPARESADLAIVADG